MKCRRLCAAFVVTAALSGCASTREGTLAQICNDNGWREIGVRKSDKISNDTAREIIGNNVAREAWCNAKRVGA